MQKRATALIIASVAVFAYAGRDMFVIPFLDRIESHDTEIAGCIRLDEGEATRGGVTEDFVYSGPVREPVRGTIGKNSSLYVELRNVGVSAFDIDTMTKETKKTFDWRKVRAGRPRQPAPLYQPAGLCARGPGAGIFQRKDLPGAVRAELSGDARHHRELDLRVARRTGRGDLARDLAR
jgi:hypothetical protein